METQRSVFGAPWSSSVKAISLAATILLGGIALLEALVLPRHLLGGWPWIVGTFLPLAILLGGALFVIRGYSLEPGTLRVQRLLWQTAVPLDSLHTAWASPDAMAGSLRVFGNGGLYSLSGRFRSSRLGSYRAFAMDPKRAVVLELADRKVVVTPDSPEAFLGQLQLVSPGVSIGEPPQGRPARSS